MIGMIIVVVIGVVSGRNGGDVCGVGVGGVGRWWGGLSVVHGGIVVWW